MAAHGKYRRMELKGERALFVCERTVSVYHPKHSHTYFELEVILAGEGRYVINGQAYDLTRERVFFLTPTDVHYLELEGEVRLINLSFGENLLPEGEGGRLLDLPKAYAPEDAAYHRLVDALRLLIFEYESDGEYGKELLRYVLGALLRESGRSLLTGGAPTDGIERARQYIELHFREPLSERLLAEVAGYRPSYFGECFRRRTGEGYGEMLTRLRLSYACRLLKEGGSVADACFLSGFGSLSRFSAVFRQSMGMTAREYRAARRR